MNVNSTPVRILVLVLTLAAGQAAFADEPSWKPLFNGRDLRDWTPKVRGHDAGINFAETFRVRDGLLQVRYDQYGGEFRERFGHLFYNGNFSHYALRVEYRFVGEQLPDGPGWAVRNSGLMLHGQSPLSMTRDQSFPVSIEVQLLGGGDVGDRSTANLCTPGTNVVIDSKLFTPHCLNSKSPTFRGDEWVTVEMEVRGNQVIEHRVNGQLVLSYQQPQLDPKDGDAQRLLAQGVPLQLEGGTISLQSESHPIDFRKVEWRDLTR